MTTPSAAAMEAASEIVTNVAGEWPPVYELATIIDSHFKGLVEAGGVLCRRLDDDIYLTASDASDEIAALRTALAKHRSTT